MQRVGLADHIGVPVIDAREVGFDQVVVRRQVEREGWRLGDNGTPDHLAEVFAVLCGMPQADPHGLRGVGEVP